jgi:hypothetical protein
MSNTTAPTIANTELGDLLTEILKVHNTSWINPKAIFEKGKSNPEFQALNEVALNDIRSTLNEMAALNKIKKRKSEKGNWFLYRL